MIRTPKQQLCILSHKSNITTRFRHNGKEATTQNCNSNWYYGDLVVCINIVCSCVADNQRFNQTCCWMNDCRCHLGSAISQHGEHGGFLRRIVFAAEFLWIARGFSQRTLFCGGFRHRTLRRTFGGFSSGPKPCKLHIKVAEISSPKIHRILHSMLAVVVWGGVRGAVWGSIADTWQPKVGIAHAYRTYICAWLLRGFRWPFVITHQTWLGSCVGYGGQLSNWLCHDCASSVCSPCQCPVSCFKQVSTNPRLTSAPPHMYTYIYIYIHTCIYVYMLVTYTVCVYMYIHIYIYIYIHAPGMTKTQRSTVWALGDASPSAAGDHANITRRLK